MQENLWPKDGIPGGFCNRITLIRVLWCKDSCYLSTRVTKSARITPLSGNYTRELLAADQCVEGLSNSLPSMAEFQRYSVHFESSQSGTVDRKRVGDPPGYQPSIARDAVSRHIWPHVDFLSTWMCCRASAMRYRDLLGGCQTERGLQEQIIPTEIVNCFGRCLHQSRIPRSSSN